MTRDGINDNYFKGAAKTNEEKAPAQFLGPEEGTESCWWQHCCQNVISNPSANQRNREESSQPAAAVKPIQEQPVKSSKGGNVVKLAVFYADKLSEIKAANTAKLKEETSKET